jgi:hypothetical protein
VNVEKLRELIDRYAEADVENDIESDYFWKESFKILSIDLNETIEYLDSISAEDLYYIRSIFDDLSEHFKSIELIDCMERNAKRTNVDCTIDVEYAKKYLS